MASTAAVASSLSVPIRTRESTLVTWIVIAFLAWMPLCTPVSLLAWENHLVSVPVAQAILLVKDGWAAGLIAVLFLRHIREIRFRWFDWCALAYAALVVVYSVVPSLLGSHLSALSVIASARELLVPVELYGLGRLAGYAGVSTATVVKAFLVIAAVAAAFTVAAFVLEPGAFWQNTYELVNFIRVVQGVPTAWTTWQISLLTMYGSFGEAIRAVGPFSHPVGTGVYFAMPLTLVVCAAWLSSRRQKVAMVTVMIGVVLFALAVITPISRGTWIGFVGAVVVCGAVLHRYRLSVLTVVVFAAFIVLVPPFSWSVWASVAGNDSSTNAHTQTVQKDVTHVLTTNPVVGPKVGAGDSAGQNYTAGDDAAGVGENMYLTAYASVGPLGALAFVAWLGALLVELFGRVRSGIPAWISIGVAAGLLAEVAAGMTASTLMRFTTSASMMLLVGLVVAQPTSGSRIPDLAALRHPRQWFRSRGVTTDDGLPDPTEG